MYEAYNEQIPKEAIRIIETIEEAGYEAYIVGGCVRDMLMGRKPNDWDITTSAKPEEVKRIFKRTYDTGIQHGTVTVILSKEHFEVTTYRIEGDYKDFRRPENVAFVEDITLDLSRRDFSMNAIAYHPTRGFVDPYCGAEDIKNGIIRCVGEASMRFREDALRILRAVRFSAQLDFLIEEGTLKGIRECKDLLAYISKERIRDEFVKICISKRPERIKMLYELELLQYIVPQFVPAFTTPQNHPHHIFNVAEHTLRSMREVPEDTVLRMAMFLHDIGKPYTHTTDKKGVDHFFGHAEKGIVLAKGILKELRFDNDSIKNILLLIKNHDYHLKYKVSKVTVKMLLNEMGEGLFDKLMLVQEADAKAQNPEKLPPKLDQIQRAKEFKEETIRNKECYSKAMLAINGSDLIESCLARGKIIGELLDQALDYVIKHPDQNNKEILMSYCQKRAPKEK